MTINHKHRYGEREEGREGGREEENSVERKQSPRAFVIPASCALVYL